MRPPRSRERLATIVLSALVSLAQTASSQTVSFTKEDGRLQIRVDAEEFATYVWEDPEIPRPYFCQVNAPNGMPVARTRPPDPELDKNNDDHLTYHPGVWLAFGDLGGADFWRNKARVRHLRFEQAPEGGDFEGRFTVVNVYETMETPPRTVCEETCAYTVRVLPEGWLLTSDSEFRATEDGIAFGDQEEMGFGVRLFVAITPKHVAADIWNSEGGRNEKGTWGKTARWCAAAGTIFNDFIGLAVLVGPDNFRPSWFHTRDYGLIVANPFGRKAMTAPDEDAVAPDATILKRGEPFRLKFGLFVFARMKRRPPNMDTVWKRFASVPNVPEDAE